MTNQLSLSDRSLSTPTTVVLGNCECELVSIDCLDAIKCLPQGDEAMRTITRGITTRKVMKDIVTFSGKDTADAYIALGKGIQYASIRAWQSLKKKSVLPVGYTDYSVGFVNETWYPHCMENQLLGKNCFFRNLNDDEDLDPLEEEALRVVPETEESAGAIRDDIKAYLSKSDPDDATLPGLGHLMVFSHVARLRFNRQPTLRQVFDAHLTTVASQNRTTTDNVLRVSVHMRRADSCDHKTKGFQKEASLLESIPQTSGVRMCYATSVYMKALQRVQKMSQRPLEVYLSTDYGGEVMAEIKKDFNDLYQSITWKYLKYDRDIFQYGVMIDDIHRNKKLEILGETGFADLWLLSHGEVFVGHLGSRFGKVGWSLATARYNHFIPFFTVDGHSFCCAIDENCGFMKDYMDSMEVCISYQQELMKMAPNKDYWTAGSKVRMMAVERDRAKKNETQKASGS